MRTEERTKEIVTSQDYTMYIEIIEAEQFSTAIKKIIEKAIENV